MIQKLILASNTPPFSMNEGSGLRKLGAMSLRLTVDLVRVRYSLNNKNAVTYISPGTGLCMR